MSVVNTIKSGLGSKLSISEAAFTGTKDATGYATATYHAMTIEAFSKPGESFDMLTWRDLMTGNPTYIKGGKTFPAIDVSVADLPTDSAITALNLAFSDMTGEFAFKGEHTTDGTLTPRITYFTGRVSSKTPGEVSLNGILMVNYTIQVTSPSVIVAPT